MTKTFSALAVVLAGLGTAATAQIYPTQSHSFSGYAPMDLLAWPGGDLGTPGPETLGTATPPTWMYAHFGADPETVDLLVWASTRPETWGADSAPYQVAFPGPTYVGLIPAPVPEGWVVTHRCLAWDDYYANAEAPQGDCYIFEMRPLIVGPRSNP